MDSLIDLQLAYPGLLPDLDPDDYARLKDDIAEHGLKVPIEIDAESGKILDGWQRYRICRELGLELGDAHLEKRSFGSEDERKWHAISLNVHRRHLTKSQIACYLVEYKLEPEERKAKERMSNGGKKSAPGRPAEKGTLPTRVPFSRAGTSAEILGKEHKMGKSVIEHARQIKKESPELFEQVKEGKFSAHTAMGRLYPETYHHSRPSRQSEPSTSASGKRKPGKTKRGQAQVSKATFCATLLADIEQKLKELNAAMNPKWRPEAVRAASFYDILTWIMQTLKEAINLQLVSDDTDCLTPALPEERTPDVSRLESRNGAAHA